MTKRDLWNKIIELYKNNDNNSIFWNGLMSDGGITTQIMSEISYIDDNYIHVLTGGMEREYDYSSFQKDKLESIIKILGGK